MANTANTASIELDVAIAAGPELQAFFALEAEPRGIEAKVLNERGPGGGWPAVLFSGPSKELQAFCFVNFDLSAEEFASMSK